MAATVSPDTSSRTTDAPPKLRTNVLDALMKARGIETVEAQAKYLDLNRTHWFKVRAGETEVLVGTAMRIARRLETTVEALFGESS